MGHPKKITVDVDSELLQNAQRRSGESISDTVRLGLQLLAASSAFDKALKLRGKIRSGLSWKQIKEDR